MNALLMAVDQERKRSFSDTIETAARGGQPQISVPKKKARSTSAGAPGGSPCGSFVLAEPGLPKVVYRRASVYFSIVKSSRKFPGYFDPNEKTRVVMWTKNIANGGADMDADVYVTARTGSGRDRHKITRKWNYLEVKAWYTNLYTRLCNTVRERKENGGGKRAVTGIGKTTANIGDATPPLSRSNSARSETPSTLVRAMGPATYCGGGEASGKITP